MEVEVLGTHFNINGYTDEDAVKTTLLEGKVKVLAANTVKYLAPGQQAQVKSSGNIDVTNDVNLEETVAWKDGNFQFENADIKAVMRQLARWYDVEVSYKGNINKHFVGGISRDVKLSQVLSMLQQTGEVKFKIEGKNLIVMP
jgi:ferric-dicitrate binding protein FerR (iron transport regulator)